MSALRQSIPLDLSRYSVAELRQLIERIDKALDIKKFEEQMAREINDYKRRDPQVIRF